MEDDKLARAERVLALDVLYHEMEEFSVKWHKNHNCICMNDFPKEITGDSYVPCEHLKEALWKEYKEKINKIEKMHTETMRLKLVSALAN